VTTGVVLLTYGAPRDDADVGPYLGRVIGRVPTDAVVTELRRRYRVIGGSPLVARTEEQARALEAALGTGFRVRAGMRASAPTIADAVTALGPVERIVGVVLSPQWSGILMRAYVDQLTAAATAPVHVAGAWHREPAFVASLGRAVRAAHGRLGGPHVLLTAHSLPRRVFDAEPEYVAQLRETGTLVAAAAGLCPAEWTWAYQSAGHTAEEWLRPDLKELFPALAAAGHRAILVAPVQFLADHLEVLYDLDVAARGEAEGAGLAYHRIAMPNADPAFIAALAAVVRRTLAEARAPLSSGA
jgi:ferrochelatase